MPLRIDCGLSVRNTDVYFVIRNMYVHAATYGIVLSDVRNGEIDNSTLVNNGLGGSRFALQLCYYLQQQHHSEWLFVSEVSSQLWSRGLWLDKRSRL